MSLNGFPGAALASLDGGGGSSTGPFTRAAATLPLPRIYPTVPGDWIGFPSPASAPNVPDDMPLLYGEGVSGSVDMVFNPLDAAGIERPAGAFKPATNGNGSLGTDMNRWGKMYGVDAQFNGILMAKNATGIAPPALFGVTKMIMSDDSGGASGFEIHASLTNPFEFVGGLVGVNESVTLGTKMLTLTGIITSPTDANMGSLVWGVKAAPTDPDITLFMLLDNNGRLQLVKSGVDGGISIGGANTPHIYNSGNDLALDSDSLFNANTAATLGTIPNPWANGILIAATFQNQSAVPGGSPPTGFGRLWTKTDKTIHFTDEDGTDYDLTAGGGGFITRDITASLVPITLGDAFGFNSTSSVGIFDKATLRGVGVSDAVDLELSFTDSAGSERSGASLYPVFPGTTNIGKSGNEFLDIYTNRIFANVVEAWGNTLYFKTASTVRAFIENDGKFKRYTGATSSAEAIGGCYNVDTFQKQSSGGAVTDTFESESLQSQTIDTDGQSMTFCYWGYDNSKLNTLQVDLAGNTVFQHAFSTTEVTWKLTIELARINSAQAAYCVTLEASSSGIGVPTLSYTHVENGITSWDYNDGLTQLIVLSCVGDAGAGAGETGQWFYRVDDHPSPLGFL